MLSVFCGLFAFPLLIHFKPNSIELEHWREMGKFTKILYMLFWREGSTIRQYFHVMQIILKKIPWSQDRPPPIFNSSWGNAAFMKLRRAVTQRYHFNKAHTQIRTLVFFMSIIRILNILLAFPIVPMTFEYNCWLHSHFRIIIITGRTCRYWFTDDLDT